MNSFHALTTAAVVALTASSAAFCRPPTVDPTFGLPVPALHPTASVPAQWIWSAPKPGKQVVEMRRSLTLVKAPKAATLYVTGDDAFTAYVNGRRVASTEAVEQGWKNVHRCAVGAYLHAGRNVIALQGTDAGGAAGLLAELDIEGKPVLWTDTHWKALWSPAPPAAWTDAAFDDSAWTAAIAVAPVGEGPWSNQLSGWPGSATSAWYMAHRMIFPVSVKAVSAANTDITVSAINPQNGAGLATVRAIPAGGEAAALFVDFGQELAGRLEIAGTSGAKLTVTTGETPEECTHAEPALDNHGPWSLTLDGDGEPATTPYTAFRYARLQIPAGQGDVRLTRIVCDHKYYPVTYRGSFDCSDPLLTKIWYAGAYTAHLCMQEEIWDAPKRDRGLWCGDLQVTGSTIDDVFADRFLMERSIAKLRSLAQAGRPYTMPASKEVNDLPGYSAAWFYDLIHLYQRNGDIAFLQTQHVAIVSLLEFQKTDFDDRNLFVNPRKNWNFVDWAPNFVVDSPQGRIATDLFIIGGVRQAVTLLRALGDQANAAKYTAWADTLTAAAQQAFANPATHTFGTRLQTNTMAVFGGVATPEQRDAIFAQILRADSPVWKAPATQPNLDCFPMTPYYGHFVLQDLGLLDQPQAGIDLIRRYWGNMVARGSDTLWEKFDPALPANDKYILDRMPYLSYCHGWSSGPTPFLSEFVLGVQPTTAGAKTVRIAPFLGDLQWIAGTVPTPAGDIHIRAEKANDHVVETVMLPAGVAAEIAIPGAGVTVNGRAAAGVRLAAGVSYVRIARAGTYRITTTRAAPPAAQK
jgi:alpha-L-rhamnosidase